MDAAARTRAYPPLPPGAGLRVVLPRQGDLRVRPLAPSEFLAELRIHCPRERQDVYARFRVARRFVVMARSGDMFTKRHTLELRREQLPGGGHLLPLPPPLARGDILKVLDLVQCYTYPPGDDAVDVTPHVRWELVRVRWRGGRDSWVPIELLGSQDPALLQEFYVNCVNSWGFHSRVTDPASWARYRTEIELWLHQPEFQDFYKHLRSKLLRAQARIQPTASARTTAETVDVKDRQLTAEAARASTAAHAQPATRPNGQPSRQITPPPPRQLTPPPPRQSTPPQPVPASVPPPRQSTPPPPRQSTPPPPRQSTPPVSVPPPAPRPTPAQVAAREHLFPQQQVHQGPPSHVAFQHGATSTHLPVALQSWRSSPMSMPMRPPPPPPMQHYQQHQAPYQQPSHYYQPQHPATQHPPPSFHQPHQHRELIQQHQPRPAQPFHFQQQQQPQHQHQNQHHQLEHQYQHQYRPQHQHQHQLPQQHHQPLHRPVFSSGPRIPPHVLESTMPPQPPTPPRPSQDPRAVELRQQGSAPPAFSLTTRIEQARPPPPANHRPQAQTTPPAKAKQVKEKQTSKSNDNDHRSTEKEKEKKKKKKKNDVERISRRDHDSPVQEKEKEREKRKKRDRQSRDQDAETPRTKKRKRIRLRWSQAASDSDESDDLLSLPPRSKKQSETETPTRKQPKRLSKSSEEPGQKDAPIIVIDDSEEEDGNGDSESPSNQQQDAAKKLKKKEKKDKKRDRSDKKRRRAGEERTNAEELVGVEVPVEIDVDTFSDEDASTDVEGEQGTLLGTIRCVCGLTKVGRYTGQWLQCWKEECGVWQHAECVGLPLRRGDLSNVPDKYCCSTCDPEAFHSRCRDAQLNLQKWVSICCESKNVKQLFKLLEDEEQRDSVAANELAASTIGPNRVTLLMEVARYGIVNAVRRLVRRYKVNVYATDSRSHNALYHAVSGESVPVVQCLMAHSAGLVRHQDLRGRMPLHHMLQSSHLNGLCLPLLQKDQALHVTSDFDGFMPIHFACQVVNEHTVAIVRQILVTQPMAGIEKSPEGLTPLLYLCRASAPSMGHEELDKIATHVSEIIELLFDVDVLGSFLNARDPRGWTPLHFVAEAGNHALLLDLCHRQDVEIDAITFDSGETALHLAARANHAKCVEVLLANRRKRLDVDAVDGSQWIPVLRATASLCLQHLLFYDLDKQLHRISSLARNFRHHDVLRLWIRNVLCDPTTYAIVNDWLQYNIPMLDELEELTHLHRSFVRVDCKLDYLHQSVFASIRHQSRRRLHSAVAAEAAPQQRQSGWKSSLETEISLSSSSGECYWKQFVAQTRDFDALVFRCGVRVVISRGGNLQLDNLTLVLVRLLAGLLHPSTGLLVRNEADSTLEPAPHRRADDAETLREFFVLGELVAHLVLSGVSVGEVFEFSTAFLAAAVGVAEESDSAHEGTDFFAFRVFAETFAAGFAYVVPATLPLLHPEELRIVLNASTHALYTSTIDWSTAVEWAGFSAPEQGVNVEEGEVQDPVVVTWWTRMVSELAEDERVALMLWLTGSFRHAQRVFCATNEAEASSASVRVRIQRYEPPGGSDSQVTTAIDENALLPVFDAVTHTLVVPQYESYDRFRAAVLRVFRHVDSVPAVR